MLLDKLHRLGDEQILADILCDNHFLDLIHGNIVGVADAFIFGFHRIVRNGKRFQSGDLLESETELYLLFRLRTHLLAQSIEGQTRILEVGIEVKSLHSETVVIIADVIFGLLNEHRLGNIGDKLLNEGLAEKVLKLGVRLIGSSLCNFILNIGFIFIQCVEFGNILREFIVESGELLELQGIELRLEDGFLSRKIFCVIVLGEGDLDIKLVTGFLADDLLFEAGDEGTRAERQVVLFRLAALKGYAVDRTFVIDIGNVALLSRSVGHIDGAGISLAGVLKLFVNVLLRYADSLLLGFDPVVTFNLNVGFYEAGRFQDNITVCGNDLKVRGSDHFETCFLHCLFKGFGKASVDGVLEKDSFPVKSLYDMLRGFPFSEAGNRHVLDQLLIGFCLRLVVSVFAHRKLHGKAGFLGQLLFQKAHEFFSSGKLIFLFFSYKATPFYNKFPHLSRLSQNFFSDSSFRMILGRKER